MSAKIKSPAAAEARRAFWLTQYATAYSNRDKRAAAVALQFLQQCEPAAQMHAASAGAHPQTGASEQQH